MSTRPAQLALLGLVLWSGGFAAVEIYRAVKVFINSPWTDDRPSVWRLGAPPAERLKAFLEVVDRHLPEGSSAVFATSHASNAEADYALKWAGYLLPRHEVMPAHAETLGRAMYWIQHGPGPSPPGAAPVYASPAGILYRLP